MSRTGTTLLLVVMLTALPLSGTVCAALCAAAASSASAQETSNGAHHHGDAAANHHQASSTGQPQVAGLPGKYCQDHGEVGDSTAALVAGRADASVARVILHLGPSTPAYVNATSMRARPDDSPPPGAALATRAPLVLRI